VSFPIPKKSSHQKFPNPASRYALTGVFLSQDSAGKVRVAVTGAGPKVFRVTAMEDALSKSFNAAALSGIEASAKGLNTDMHATAAYRAHLIGVLARRAVAVAK
jgi:aerobic carbon-monoxide dehydrogenase medium subunit